MFLQRVFFDVEQPVRASAPVDAGLCAAVHVAARGGGGGGLRVRVGHLLKAHLVRARRFLLKKKLIR